MIRGGALGFVRNAIIAAAVLSPCISSADVSAEQAPEVKYLLNFVKDSGCELNRTGSYHKGEAAAAHIQKKYDYFMDEIKTTEDFIDYSATKSMMSGKYYTVKCGDAKEVATQCWLLNELEFYRERDKQAKNKLQ